MRDSLIGFILATECTVITSMTFTSRQQAEALAQTMNWAFGPAEEIAADAMDFDTFRALSAAHGAVAIYLADTGIQLPALLRFRFAAPNSTLYFAYRLYADASRADQLRAFNGVVHPAFMKPIGEALSS